MTAPRGSSSRSPAPIRILIVDSEELVRAGLRTMLRGEGDLQVVGEAATVTDTLAHIRRAVPDVVLLQHPLPGKSAIEVCRFWAEGDSGPKIIALILECRPSLVRSAIDAGVQGIVGQNISQKELCLAIREVAAGRVYLDPQVAQSAMALVRAANGSPGETGWHGLSAQERQILPLVAEGKTNKEIAAALSLSDKTVKNYLSSLFVKLGVVRRSQVAALYALRQQETDTPFPG